MLLTIYFIPKEIKPMGNSSKKLQKELKKSVPVKKTNDNEHTINVVMISVAVVVSVLIVALAAFLIISGAKDKSAKPNELVSFKSDNYEVDNAMLSYFYTSNFYQFYQQNYQVLAYQYGFDATKPLSQQVYDQSQGTSWHQYFINMTANNMMQLIALAEDAKASGLKLDDEDIKKIEDSITELKTQADNVGKPLDEYLEYLHGEGVTESTVREALELTAMASKQSEALVESFGTTTEECEEYYTENRTTFDKVSFRNHAITADAGEDLTEEQKQAAYDEAKAAAENIAAATSEQDYVNKVYEYLLDRNALLDSPLSNDQVLTNAQDCLTKDYIYSAGNEIDEWVFDPARKVGDSTVITTQDGAYNPILMVSLPARDETPTKTVRHILIRTSNYDGIEAAEAKRDELQAAWDASDKSLEAFEKLADEYNEDSSSLYENITKGQMVEAFENWCFDESRKPGDCEMVTTEYGYHLVYFVEEGLPAWEYEAKNSINSSKLEANINELVEKYNVTFDTEKIARIKDYNAYQATPLDTTAAESVDTAIDTAADTTVDIAADTTVDTAA